MAIVEIELVRSKFEPGDRPKGSDYLDLIDTLAALPDISGKQDVVANVSSTEIGYLDGVTSAIQTQINTKAPTASPTFTGTVTIPSGSAITGVPYLATANTFTGGVQQITTASAATVGLIVKASASQTANIVEFQLADNAQPYFFMTPAGNGIFYTALSVNQSNSGSVGANNGIGAFEVKGTSFMRPVSAAGTVLIVRGAASQTANLQEWQTSTGQVNANIGSTGAFYNYIGVFADNTNSGITSLTVTTAYANVKPMIVKGHASQTANLQEWQNSAGTVLSFIRSDGLIRADAKLMTPTIYSPISNGTQVNLATAWTYLINAAANTGIIVKGFASQTANLQEWQDSAGAVLASISASGVLGLNTGGTGVINLGDGQISKGPGNGFRFNSDLITTNGKGMYPSLAYINNTTSTSTVPLTVKGAVSQTADLSQWQNSAGTVLLRVNSAGQIQAPQPASVGLVVKAATTLTATVTNAVGSGTTVTYTAANTFTAGQTVTITGIDPVAYNLSSVTIATATTTTFTVTNAATGTYVSGGTASAYQTANLQEWQNSAGTLVANIYSNGTAGLYGLEVFTGGAQITGNYANTDTLQVNINGAARRGILVKAIASQTANLQEWQNSAGTVLASINSGGNLILGNQYISNSGASGYGRLSLLDGGTNQTILWPSSAGLLIANAGVAGMSVVKVRGASGQTANLQEWQNSAGTVLTYVRNDGLIHASAGILTTGSFIGSNGYIADTQLSSTARAATVIGAVIRGAASQTANLQEWQDSAGTVVAIVSNTGTIRSGVFANLTPALTYIATNYDTQGIGIVITNSAYKGLIVRGAASQTANLQEWQNSAGTALGYIGAGGQLKGVTVSAGSDNLGAAFSAFTNGAGNKGIVVRATASQTANLIEIQDSTGGQKFIIGGTNVAGDKNSYYGFGLTSASIYGGFGRNNNTGLVTYYQQDYAGAGLLINSGNAGTIPFTVKGATSQTADLQQWQDSAGTVLGKITTNGHLTAQRVYAPDSLYVVATGGPGTVNIETYASNGIGVIIKGKASQTANLQEWQDSAGTVLSGINAAGQVYAGTTASINGSNTTAVTSAAFTSAAVAVFTYGGTSLVQAGQRVTVAGVTGGTYNGTWTVTAVTSTTFTVIGSGFTNVAGTGGTFTLSAAGSFVAGTAAITPIVVRGAASQTANLTQWQDSAGTVMSWVNSTGGISLPRTALIRFNGGVGFDRAYITSNTSNDLIFATAGGVEGFRLYGGATPSGALLTNSNASAIGFIIKGAASQTANLQEWQDSAGTANAFVNSSAQLAANRVTAGSPTIQTTARLFGVGGITTDVVLGLRGAASATGDYVRMFTNAGVVMGGYNALGQSFTGSTTPILVATGGATTAASGDGTTATITTTSVHGLAVGDLITIAGVTPTGYNATALLTAVASTTISYLNATTGAQTIAGTVSAPAQASVTARSAGTRGLVVKAAASQTADLQQWQNSAGTVLSRVQSDGTIRALSLNTSSYISDLEATRPYIDFTVANKLIVNTRNAAYVGLTVKGQASQTANLQEWQDSAGTVLARVDPYYGHIITSGYVQTGLNDGMVVGGVYVIRNNYGSNNSINIGNNVAQQSAAQLQVTNSAAGIVGLIVKGAASQTADLQQWQTSTGTTLAKLDSSGNVIAADYRFSNSLYSVRKNIKKVIDPAGSALANNTYDLFEMNFPSSLQGTFYIQVSIRGAGYGQNMTYSLPATYVMDWISQYGITNPFTNSTTWVDLTPFTFSPRHLMTTDYLKFQARVSANTIFFRIKLTGALTGSPVFDVYLQHSEEFVNSTITELFSTGTDATVSNVMPNFLSSKSGLSVIFNPLTITASATGNIPLSVKSASGQTADLQQWQNSAGTVNAKIASNGDFTNNGIFTVYGRFGGASFTDAAALRVNGYSTSVATAIIKGLASQTANLQEWQDSSGAVIAKLDPAGGFTAGTPATTNIKLDATAAGAKLHFGIPATFNNYATLGAYNSVFNIEANARSIIATVTNSTTTTTLIVKAIASQTANLQEWQNSAGTVLAKVTAAGDINIDPSWGANFHVQASGGQVGDYNLIKMSQVSTQKTTLLTTVVSGGNTEFSVKTLIGSLTTTLKIDKDSLVGIGKNNTSPLAQIDVRPQSASTIGAIIRGAASQTANLQEWQDSTGAVNASMTSLGRLNLGGAGLGSYSLTIRATDAIILYHPDNTSAIKSNIAYTRGNTGGTPMYLGSIGDTANGVAAITTTSGAGSTSITSFGVNGNIVTNLQSASAIGLIVKAAASQTANLLEFQNSGGTAVTFFNASGGLTATEGVISTLYSGGQMTTGTLGYYNATTFNAAVSPIVVRGTTSQTADLTQWQNSAGTVATKIDSIGGITFTANGNNTSISGQYGGLTVRSTTTAASLNTSAHIHTGYAAGIGVMVRGSASQTADLQQWQDSAGTVLTSIRSDGRLWVGTTTEGYATLQSKTYTTGALAASFEGITSGTQTVVYIKSIGAAQPGLVIRAATSQTANLQEWQDSAGTVIAKVNSSGNIVAGNMAIATSSVSTIHISNGTIPSADPTGGGVLYVEAGALKFRGSSGTVTTIAVA